MRGGLTIGMQRGDVKNFEHLCLARLSTITLDGVMSCVAFVDKGGVYLFVSFRIELVYAAPSSISVLARISLYTLQLS